MLGIPTKKDIFFRNLVLFEGNHQDDSREIVKSILTDLNICNSTIKLSPDNICMLGFKKESFSLYSKSKTTICSNSSAIIHFFESMINNMSSRKGYIIFDNKIMKNVQLQKVVQNQKEFIYTLIEKYRKFKKIKDL